MKKLQVLFISDNFLKYELMYKNLKNALEKINYRIIPDVINTKWPDIPFENDNSITEYVNVDTELSKKIINKDIVITHVGGIKRNHIINANRLTIIGCIRSLPVNVDVNTAKERDIKIIYAPGRSTEAVAEFTVGLIISIRRKICNAHIKLKKGNWDHTFFYYDVAPPPLHDTTIGIIGFGCIGKRVCKLLSPFNCEILVYDPLIDSKSIEKSGAKPVTDMKYLLKKSDIISIHARPLDLKTKIIGESEINLMKKSAYLINTSRGYLLDYNALYKALKEGKIAGAAIDTYEDEPIDSRNPLLSLNNIIITPHIAGATRSTAETGLKMVCKGISNLLKGKEPENIYLK